MKKNLLTFIIGSLVTFYSYGQTALIEDFNGGTLPTGWAITSVSANDSWFFGGGVDFGPTVTIPDASGNIGEYARIDFSNDNDTTSLITPALSIAGLSNPRLTFQYITQTTSVAFTPFNRLILDYWNGVSWTNITVLDTLTPAGWTLYDFNITTFTFGANSDSVQFRFSAQEGGAAIGGTGTFTFDQDLALDEVTIEQTPTCLKPTNLGTTATASGVDFRWTDPNAATSGEIEYGITGFTLGTGTRNIVSSSPANLTGFIAGNTYDWYFRAICGLGDSSVWVQGTPFVYAGPPLASGIYTVDSLVLTGGTNFQSFRDLEYALNNAGVAGPITVNVMPNTYNEDFTLFRINGASATNTITIDGGSPTTTTISHDKSIRNYTVGIRGASYTTFKNFSVITGGTGLDKWGIQIRDSSHHITIDSNVIILPIATTSDVAGIVISGAGADDVTQADNAYNLTISNNTIRGGERSVTIVGNTTVADKNLNLVITNNTLTQADDYGIYVQGYDSLRIENNLIDSLNNVGSDAIYVLDVENFDIVGNYARANDNGFEGRDLNFDAPARRRSTFINNMIIGGDDAIFLDDIEDINMYHNSSSAEDRALSFNDHVNLDIRNNIFSSNSDNAIFIDDAIGTITLNYNLYESLGVDIANVNGTAYADLIAFQAGEPTLNLNSLSGDPVFRLPGIDLHPIGVLANDVGDNSVGILVDFDGDVRPLAPSITVDMGADEFHPPTCLQPSNLVGVASVTGYDLGWTENNSATLWEIEYGTTGFTLGAGTRLNVSTNPTTISGLIIGTTYDWYVRSVCTATDSSFWVKGNSFNFAGSPISGAYTIDSTLVTGGTNFQSFSDLAFILNNAGINGALSVTVMSNTYNDQFSLTEIAGASATNTVMINGGSSAATILTHDKSIRNSTITLEGTNYITLKNMTIAATGGADSWGIQMMDSAHHILIDSNVFIMPIGTTGDVAAINVSSSEISDAGSGFNAFDVTISNNTITGGERGMAIIGNILATARNLNLTIKNNNIQNFDDNGLYIQGYDNLVMTSNFITNSNINTFNDAIYISDIENFNINGNYAKGSDLGFDADDLNFDNPVTVKSTIANNMFIGGDDAFWLDDIEEIDIFHNSTYAEDRAISFNDHVNLDIRNNIFSSNSDNAIFIDDVIGSLVLDYNVYYTLGTAIANVNGTAYTDFNAFKVGEPTLNISSLSGDPVFINPTDDLHSAGTLPNDVGDNRVGILVDIDGDTRPLAPSTTVDIGADEFNPPLCPAPIANAATLVGPDSAIVSWIESGISTQWEIEYDTSGFTLGTGISILVNIDTFATINGLTSGESYDYYVRSVCGRGDSSTFTPVRSFLTTCSAITITTVLPFVEDWEMLAADTIEGLSASVNCDPSHTWDFVTAGPTGRIRVGSAAVLASGGSAAVTMDVNVSGTFVPNDLILTLDMTSYTTANNLELLFDYADHGDEDQPNDSVWVRGSNTDSWVGIFDLNPNTVTNGVYTSVGPFDIDAALLAAGQTVSSSFQVRFGQEDNFPATSTTASDGISFDNIEIREGASCLDPTNLITSEIKTTGADLSWNDVNPISAPNYEYSYGVTNFTAGSGTQLVVTTDSVTVTGLTSSTSYDWYVRAICAPGDTSVWSVVASFTTNFLGCAPTVATTLPFTEGWETLTDTTLGNNNIICNADYTWYLTTNDSRGRARYGTSAIGVSTGTGAITLDRNPGGVVLDVANDLILTLDIAAYSSSNGIELSFDYVDHGDEQHANDFVWVRGDAANSWVQVYDLFANKGVTGTYNNVGPIDVDAALATAGQTVGSTFQVRFGQEDNFPATAPLPATGDGYSFDNILIADNPVTLVDPYYSIGTINTEDATTGVADSLNVFCWTSGTVVGIDLDGNAGLSFYISDLSSGSQEGINVFNFADVSGYIVTEGDSILIHGEVDQFNGLTELVVDSISIISTGHVIPTPNVVSTLDESTEAQYLSIPTRWVSLSTSSTFSSNIDLTNGVDTITMRIDSDTDIIDSLTALGMAIVPFDTICGLVGIGGQFDNSSPFTSGYQIFPMRWSDLTICRFSTGINNNETTAAAFKLVPNPTNGTFEIRSNEFQNPTINISIRDINGRVVSSEFVNNATGNFNKSFDLNQEAKGIYFITILDGNNVINEKLILQ